MNILHIPSWYPSSGSDNSGLFTKDLIDSLSENKKFNHVVLQISYVNIFNLKWLFIGNKGKSVVLPKLPTNYIFFLLLNNIILFLKCRNLFKYYSVFHFHNCLDFIFLIKIFNLLNKKVISTEHSSDYLYKNRFLRLKLLKYLRIDICVCVSHSLLNEVKKYLISDFYCIPNVCLRLDFTNSIRLTNSIIWVGRMDENKNPYLLFRFLKKLPFFSDINVTIIGSGPLLKDVKNKYAHFNNIEFISKLDNVSVKRRICSSSILFSTSYKETFGMTLLEAICYNTPIVSTRSSGALELISDYDYGHFIDDDNLESVIKNYLLNPKQYFSSELFIDNYSLDSICSKYVGFYENFTH